MATPFLTPTVTTEPLSFMPKSIRERLIDGEITEEQLVDMFEARGASLVDASQLGDDDDFVRLLAGTVVIPPFDRMVMPRFTRDVAELAEKTLKLDLRKILCEEALRV